MDIRSEIQAQLAAHQQSAAPDARCDLRVDWPEGALTAELTQLNSLGCAMWAIEVESDQLRALDADGLDQVAQQLAQRVRYLLEPLQVHEIDRHAAAVQVRSQPPQRTAGVVRYFEATVTQQSGIRFLRYEKAPGETRRHVAALVTLEVLQHLGQDLVDLATHPA